MAARFLVIATIGTLLAAGVAALYGQMPASHSPVEMKGVKPAMKFEAPVEGFLKGVNGKLKLRASEVEFEPGGALGDHYHVGPGIRLVLAGELTVVDAATGKEQRVQAGGYFYEAGDASFRVQNRGAQPAKLLVMEILPASWQGTAMATMDRRAELEQEGIKLQKQLCPGN